MEECACGRWVAGQTIGLNKKLLGRNIEKFMCIDCLAKFLGTTRELLFDRIRDFIEIEKCELFQDEKIDKTKSALTKAQALPLKEKIRIACERITDWYYFYKGQVYVSFSGGKDSTVLLDIVHKLFPDVEAVFVNTGLEYPEIQKFVKTFGNITILRPKMRYDEVIKTYGYPVIGKDVAKCLYYAKRGSQWAKNYLIGLNSSGEVDSFKKSMYAKYAPISQLDFNVSDQCCRIMKESQIEEYQKKINKKPIIGTMAKESQRRTWAWTVTACNAFDSQRPISKPLSIWTEHDVLQYVKQNNLPIASVYGEVVCVDKDGFEYSADLFGEYETLKTTGCDRTGCIFCAFGCHSETSPSRFERLKITHPRQYEYCIGGGEYNENGVWQPNEKGLGMGHVFDELNEIYGEGFIKY